MKLFFVSVLSFFFLSINAQPYFFQSNELPVEKDGVMLELAWTGGVNSPQLSEMDYNMDGLMDLVLFDRTDSNIVLLRNNGSGGESAYRYDFRTEYDFPRMRFWALFRDINNDGLDDIFTGGAGICRIYENTSVGETVSFEFMDTLFYGNSTIYATQPDIPAIEDVDGDGDLDWLSFGVLGTTVYYYENVGTPEEHDFESNSICWGQFTENAFDNSVNLNEDCYVSAPFAKQEGGLHGASTLAAYDLNNDGDMELFIGDFSYGTVTMLTNGGTATEAVITAQDTLYPQNDESVDLKYFPAVYFADIDHDGEKDMVVAPNTTSDFANTECMWYYKNEGTTALPDFQFVQKDVLQDQMIEVGRDAKPVFFDYNDDGLLDLFVGNHHRYLDGEKKSSLTVFENVGSDTSPSYKFISDDFNSISTLGLGIGLSPCFGDLDNDGDADMVIGTDNGRLYYFENAPIGSLSDFTLAATEYFGIDVGDNASPQLFDLNADGMLDLIIGENEGNLNYYQNTGTVAVPNFVLESENIGNIDPDNIPSSTPQFFYDTDTLKLMIGTKDEGLHFYKNIDSNLTDTFELITSSVADIKRKYNANAAIADLNGDGYPELLVGLLRGGMHFYQGLSPNNIGLEEFVPQNWDVYPNPSKNLIYIKGNAIPSSIQLYNVQGQIVASFKGVDKINIKNLKAGVYFMTITHGQDTQTERIVKN